MLCSFIWKKKHPHWQLYKPVLVSTIGLVPWSCWQLHCGTVMSFYTSQSQDVEKHSLYLINVQTQRSFLECFLVLNHLLVMPLDQLLLLLLVLGLFKINSFTSKHSNIWLIPLFVWKPVIILCDGYDHPNCFSVSTVRMLMMGGWRPFRPPFTSNTSRGTETSPSGAAPSFQHLIPPGRSTTRGNQSRVSGFAVHPRWVGLVLRSPGHKQSIGPCPSTGTWESIVSS